MYPRSDQNTSYETDDTIYFFSHAFDPLNNWSAHQVKLWGITFATVEHGYHYRKFDETKPTVAQEILAAPSPYKALRIAKEHRAERRSDWKAQCIGVMTELIRAKAEQNDDVRDALLATGNKRIVENSPWDDFWGCGADGLGANHTGKILMQIRGELRKKERNI